MMELMEWVDILFEPVGYTLVSIFCYYNGPKLKRALAEQAESRDTGKLDAQLERLRLITEDKKV